MWLGDLLSANQDNALWLNGSANISPSCVSVTYHVTSGLQRESESCLLPQAAVLCQKIERSRSEFDKSEYKPDKILYNEGEYLPNKFINISDKESDR